jgi:hypothetical protein
MQGHYCRWIITGCKLNELCMGSFWSWKGATLKFQFKFFILGQCVEIPIKMPYILGKGFQIPVETQLGKEYISGI